jgi:hypothetical protein
VPVQPRTVAKDRDALTPSRATADPTAAALQVERRLTHRAQLTPLVPHRPMLRALAPRVAPRRRLGGDNVRLTQRWTRARTHDVPHALAWFPAKATASFGDVRRRWPTLQAVRLARRPTLARFFRAHHGRTAAVITTRLEASKNAVARTTEDGGSAPPPLLGPALVAPRRVPVHALADVDTAMAPRAHAHPTFPWLDAWPGAGAVVAPRLRVAFGEHRARRPAAAARPPEAGRAPVTARRGQTSWVHWRGPGPTCLRHTCVDWAAASLRPSCWAPGYDPQHRDQGTSHHAAVRALAFQWRRIRLRGWPERTPDDEATDLQALQRRGSSLIPNLAQSS